MSIESIYNKLISAGLTPTGACALMGNMKAESGMKSNIAQRGMTKYCDEDYTALADNNGIDFIHDAVGYGLCQWTHYERKGALLTFAGLRGVSVGNEDMQVDFCIEELKSGYSGLYAYLCTTRLPDEAVYRICTEYEKPAVNNTDVRSRFALEFYMKFVEGELLSKGDAFSPKTELEMPIVRRGDNTPEGKYLASLLRQKGYDVLWEGLYNCLVDYQRKAGLAVDGVCGKNTWAKLMEE